MRSRPLALVLAALNATQLAAAAPFLHATTPPLRDPSDNHIVLLSDPPLASYRGGVSGLAATSPEVTGDAMLGTGSPASASYLDHLDRVQASAIAAVERTVGHPVRVSDRYRYASNGFAVRLSPGEAAHVAGLPGVLLVERAVKDPLLTDAGPAWSGALGVWDGSAIGRPEGSFGEGVVIGVIDGGINIDHPSFAAVDGYGYAHVNPRGQGNYLGWCNPSHPKHDPKWVCNDKLIGMWSHPESGNNPEDDDGHGSHTASTAGGNRIENAALVGPTITIARTISGVAPHANMAAYDACVSGFCDSTATVAAIDQAVADRVDVINYSVGVGQDSPWKNTRSRAFLAAREAGIFVAVSAANAGPEAATIYANAPWLLSVGNSTHNRTLTHELILSGGGTPPPAGIKGKGATAGLGTPRRIRYAKGVRNIDLYADNGECLRPFPPRTFDGEIVLCDRNEARNWVERAVRGENVKAGGAAGIILANTAAEGDFLFLDAHALPAVHISYADGQALKAWLASGTGHRGGIGELVVDEAPANGDVMNIWSSRGPVLLPKCCRRPDLAIRDLAPLDVLKPDVTAPGSDILAAVQSGGARPAPEYDFKHGTSMASPHAAGAAALLHAVHRDWSPAAIQSALMTTARFASMRKEDGVTPAGPFDRGAGHIDAARAARAGFVLEAPGASFRAADPDSGGDPKTLNLASFQDAACLIACTWERTLTGTAAEAVTWTARSAHPAGSAGPAVSVDPPVFTLGPGGRQTIRVTADVSGLPVDGWAFADLSLESSNPKVPEAHFPLAVIPVAAEHPPVVLIRAEEARGRQTVAGLQASGQARAVHGLVEAEPRTAAIEQDRTPWDVLDSPQGTMVVTLTVPADARRLVAEVVASRARAIALYVYQDTGSGTRTPRSASSTGAPLEYCDVRSPAPGRWWVIAQNLWASDNPPDETTIVTALVPATDAGNLVASAPDDVAAGLPFDLDLAWHLPEIHESDRWYGAVSLGADAARPDRMSLMAVDLVGVAAGSGGTPTPTAATQTPTQTRATATPARATVTATRPTPTPVGNTDVCLPVLFRSAGG